MKQLYHIRYNMLMIVFYTIIGIFYSGTVNARKPSVGQELHQCEQGLDTLSVGDIWLNSTNYVEFKLKHKMFILAIGDTTCKPDEE